jgi:hypothetical protein
MSLKYSQLMSYQNLCPASDCAMLNMHVMFLDAVLAVNINVVVIIVKMQFIKSAKRIDKWKFIL